MKFMKTASIFADGGSSSSSRCGTAAKSKSFAYINRKIWGKEEE